MRGGKSEFKYFWLSFGCADIFCSDTNRKGKEMRTYKTIMYPKQFESRIVCNKCGHEMDLDKEEYEEFMTDTIHEFKVSYGYGSEHDLQSYSFDLCENCLDELYRSFKVPPQVDDWYLC